MFPVNLKRPEYNEVLAIDKKSGLPDPVIELHMEIALPYACSVYTSRWGKNRDFGSNDLHISTLTTSGYQERAIPS
jgi:hypothetical protein